MVMSLLKECPGDPERFMLRPFLASKARDKLPLWLGLPCRWLLEQAPALTQTPGRVQKVDVPLKLS